MAEKRQLLHFTATWCGPCQSMAPAIKKFKDEHPEIEYVKIDMDEDGAKFNEYAEKYAFSSVPTMIAMIDDLFYRGRRGASTKDELLALFD